MEENRENQSVNLENKLGEIDNSGLEQVISQFITDQNKDNMIKLMGTMHRASLFVPATFPPDTNMELLKDLPHQQAVKVPDGVKLIPAILSNAEGNKFLPVFTSREQIPADQKYPAVLCMPFVECRNLLDKSNGEVTAMAVNPYTTNLVLNPAFFEATKRAEMPRPVQKTVQMSVRQFNQLLRTQMEKGILPQLVYQGGATFINKLTENREQEIFDLFQKAYEPGEVACPYVLEDFSSTIFEVSDEFRYICLKFPRKNLVPGNCNMIYIAWNPAKEKGSYFLSELGTDGMFHLIQLTENREVKNLGEAPVEGEEIRRIMEAFEN